MRFVRFDAGHGGCYIFAFSRGGAVYCRDCRIDGGYGRSPGDGNILRFVEVARMEDCVFDRISYDLGRHAPVVFSGCTFRDCRSMKSTVERALERPSRSGPRFEHCRVESALSPEAGKRRAGLARKLKELFPVFKGR